MFLGVSTLDVFHTKRTTGVGQKPPFRRSRLLHGRVPPPCGPQPPSQRSFRRGEARLRGWNRHLRLERARPFVPGEVHVDPPMCGGEHKTPNTCAWVRHDLSIPQRKKKNPPFVASNGQRKQRQVRITPPRNAKAQGKRGGVQEIQGSGSGPARSLSTTDGELLPPQRCTRTTGKRQSTPPSRAWEAQATCCVLRSPDSTRNAASYPWKASQHGLRCHRQHVKLGSPQSSVARKRQASLLGQDHARIRLALLPFIWNVENHQCAQVVFEVLFQASMACSCPHIPLLCICDNITKLQQSMPILRCTLVDQRTKKMVCIASRSRAPCCETFHCEIHKFDQCPCRSPIESKECAPSSQQYLCFACCSSCGTDAPTLSCARWCHTSTTVKQWSSGVEQRPLGF